MKNNYFNETIYKALLRKPNFSTEEVIMGITYKSKF